ncbi:hypothetical protein [Streptomyces sp. c-19]|uniref:hypothetical protein n=1 Tax=Streptomyces sp. c-19 TaxID=2789275 RepID=UPI0039813535
MSTQEQIAAIMDHAVHDDQGKKIGDAKHVFVDDVTGRPEMGHRQDRAARHR